MTTQTVQSTINLETLTQTIESHLDSSVKITRSKQQIDGDYTLFIFRSSITGERRFIKLIPQDDGELMAVLSPIHVNSVYEKPDSDFQEFDIASIDKWLAHIIPNLFPLTQVQQVTTTLPTVSITVKGDIPSLFSNWVIIASTTYDAKYGDKYTILATKSKDSQQFLDIICDTENNYITLGSERYSQTLEITERVSLLAEADRLGF